MLLGYIRATQGVIRAFNRSNVRSWVFIAYWPPLVPIGLDEDAASLTDFPRPRWLAWNLAGTSFPFRPSPPTKDYIALDGAGVAEDTIGLQLYRYVVLLAVGNASTDGLRPS